MAKFRRKPIIIEAEQWLKDGDHPHVRLFVDPRNRTVEGVHFASQVCKKCQKSRGEHGWISALEGGHIVCPGDWIITGIAGETYPCNPGIFQATYEPVEEDPEDSEDEATMEPYDFYAGSVDEWGRKQ